MDKCGICDKPAVQLFETGNDGVYACFKCQPLVPEVTIDDSATDPPDPSESQNSNTDEESNDKSLYCGICHKSFQKTMQLQNHMRNHRAERRFVCTYCNKAFSQSNNLRAHLRIHTNERPFKCNECGKAFTQVTNLNNHVRLHTGERPFVCPEPGCNKAYAQETPKPWDPPKRRRDRNFTPGERALVARLVKKHPIVSETKLNNGKAIALKAAAWNTITDEYNRLTKDSKRSKATIKRAWENMKSLEKNRDPQKGSTNDSNDGDDPLLMTPQPENIALRHETMTFKVEIVTDDDDAPDVDSTNNTEETNDNIKDVKSYKSIDNNMGACDISHSNDSKDNTLEKADYTQNDKGFLYSQNADSDRKRSSSPEILNNEADLKLKFLALKHKAEMKLLKAQVTNLNQHRKRHLNGRPVESTYDCTVCGEQFQQRNHMYSHRREAHPEARVMSQAQRCGICDATLPSERLLRLHVAQHAMAAAPANRDKDDEESEGTMTCVFSSCDAVVRSAREHTEHLLQAHQLRVLATTAARPRPRGRPPKQRASPPLTLAASPPELKDPLDLNGFEEVVVRTTPQYIPKLKVKSLFQ